MNISFDNKVALVTGAGSGLGLAAAQAFARSGAAVVLADCDEASVVAAANDLVAQGHRALAIRCDVADDLQVESMVTQTVSAYSSLWSLPARPRCSCPAAHLGVLLLALFHEQDEARGNACTANQPAKDIQPEQQPLVR